VKTLAELRAALAERGISYDEEERIRNDHEEFYESKFPRTASESDKVDAAMVAMTAAQVAVMDERVKAIQREILKRSVSEIVLDNPNLWTALTPDPNEVDWGNSGGAAPPVFGPNVGSGYAEYQIAQHPVPQPTHYTGYGPPQTALSQTLGIHDGDTYLDLTANTVWRYCSGWAMISMPGYSNTNTTAPPAAAPVKVPEPVGAARPPRKFQLD